MPVNMNAHIEEKKYVYKYIRRKFKNIESTEKKEREDSVRREKIRVIIRIKGGFPRPQQTQDNEEGSN